MDLTINIHSQEARETFCPSRVARKYVRVEHRPSIVPDTPLFAALKANLASNKFISSAAANHADSRNASPNHGYVAATAMTLTNHGTSDTPKTLNSNNNNNNNNVVHIELNNNHKELRSDAEEDEDEDVVLPAVTIGYTAYINTTELTSETDVML